MRYLFDVAALNSRWLFAAMLVCSISAAPALAQPMPGVPARHNEALGGFAAFHDFLAQHPKLRAQLESNPNLVNQPGFAAHHKELAEFYRNHPEVRTELKENPVDYMRREKAQFAYDSGSSNFHQYLRKHPHLASELEKNPQLASDPAFLRQHPEFHKYLNAHPEVAYEMKHDPRFFMR